MLPQANDPSVCKMSSGTGSETQSILPIPILLNVSQHDLMNANKIMIYSIGGFMCFELVIKMLQLLVAVLSRTSCFRYIPNIFYLKVSSFSSLNPSLLLIMRSLDLYQ